MTRPSFAVLLLAALLAAVAVTPAGAAQPDRCRPRPGEHTLARSPQATVLARLAKDAHPHPRQTLTGCSARSGKRRVIAVIERGHTTATLNQPRTLVGLRLAGTRVAYLARRGDDTLALIADDALHGGRRHDLSAGGWPFGAGTASRVLGAAWAVDASGAVAWITTTAPGEQQLGVWRAGLGRRLVDSHALLTDLSLSGGVLRWRRGPAARSVDLAHVAPSRCDGPRATTGTLDVDLVLPAAEGPIAACLRATGVAVSTFPFELPPRVSDVNGPYVVLTYTHKELSLATVLDLVHGTSSEQLRGPTSTTVVGAHGSLAWTTSDGLWVRDAGGTRKAADRGAGPPYAPLYRDGDTVTWTGGGPTVTLNP